MHIIYVTNYEIFYIFHDPHFSIGYDDKHRMTILVNTNMSLDMNGNFLENLIAMQSRPDGGKILMGNDTGSP